MPMVRKCLKKGIWFSGICDKKFKKNQISVFLLTDHTLETAAANALIPFLLRKGCRTFPDFTSLNQQLCSLYDASLSADVGVLGTSQTINLSINTLDDRFTLSQDSVVEDCCRLLCDILMHPNLDEKGLFPQEQLEVERQILLDAIDAEQNDKRRYALLRYSRLLYSGENAAIPRYGSRESVADLTAQQVTAAYQQLMKNAQIELLFVGSGDPEVAYSHFVQALSCLEEQSRTSFLPSPVHPRRELQQVTEHVELVQSKLVMGFSSGIGTDHPLADAMRVMNIIFGSSPFSLLFRNVRERLSLCYYANSQYDRARGVMTVDSGIEENKRQQTQEEILRQLARMQAGDFPKESLGQAVLSATDALRTVSDSLTSLGGFVLTQLLTGKNRTIEQEIAKLQTVTKEQVVAAARRLQLDTVYFLTGKEGEKNGAEGF